MQVAVLAGGLATRLRPMTEKMPKSMILVKGKPFLEYQIELLKENGVKNIVLCVGHLLEQIKDYFSDGKKFGVDIKYSEETKGLLGTAGAIKNAQPLLKDEFFVMYGDSYLFVDFREVAQHLQESNKLAVMVIFKNQNKYDASNVEIKDGMVKTYNKKSQTPEMIYIDYGLSIMKKNSLNLIPDSSPCSLEALYADLISKKELAVFEAKKRFYEIGSLQGLSEFKRYIKEYTAEKDNTK